MQATLPAFSAALTIGRMNARDCLGRGALWLVALLGVLAMVMVRWLAIQGTGEELDLLKEFGVMNLGLGGALAAVLCAVPARHASMVMEADRAMQTRGIPLLTLPLGKWLGGAAVLSGLFALWTLALLIVLWWFSVAESALFTYLRVDATLADEAASLAIPVALALVQSWLLLAVALLASVRSGLVAAAAAVATVLLLLPLLSAWAGEGLLLGVLPDMSVYAASETIYGEGANTAWLVGGVLQALAWSGVCLLAAAWRRVPR